MKINPFLMKRGKRKSLFDNYKSLAAITLFILCSLTGNSQVWTPIYNNGVLYEAIGSTRFLPIPTGCGFPTFSGAKGASDSSLKKSAVYFDTCNNRLLRYNPKIHTWDSISAASTIAGRYVVSVEKNVAADSFKITYGDGTIIYKKDSIGASSVVRDTIKVKPRLTVEVENPHSFIIDLDTSRNMAQSNAATQYFADSTARAHGGGGGTPGIDDVLAVEQQLIAGRHIDANDNDFEIWYNDGGGSPNKALVLGGTGISLQSKSGSSITVDDSITVNTDIKIIGKVNADSIKQGGYAVKPYKVYVALLTQTGTDAPVVDAVLENTIGNITYSYDDVGQYSATCTGCFTTDKTTITGSVASAGFTISFNVNTDTPDGIRIKTFAIGPVDYTNDGLDHSYIEIRVYQ